MLGIDNYYTCCMKSFLTMVFVASILTLVVLLSFILVGQSSFLIKSRAQVSIVDRNNSFIFMLPPCGRAGSGELPVRVNIVALTAAGLGKGNIACKILVPHEHKVSVRAVQGITDSYGKALFDIRAEQPGVYEAKVVCDDVVINDAQKLCFE